MYKQHGQLEMTAELAYAIAEDAAHANMRKHGRSAWDEEDYNIAVETFNRLLPKEQENG